MKRIEEGATMSLAKGQVEDHDKKASGYDAVCQQAKCDWGKPERNGTKRDWYQTLFH